MQKKQSIIAVSYTHLDVYKRQPSNCTKKRTGFVFGLRTAALVLRRKISGGDRNSFIRAIKAGIPKAITAWDCS